MMLAELTHALSALGKILKEKKGWRSSVFVSGEKLTEAQVDEVYEDCMPEEDDEGQIEYERKFNFFSL